MMHYYRPLIAKIRVDVNIWNFNRGPPPSLITTRSHVLPTIHAVSFISYRLNNDCQFQYLISDNNLKFVRIETECK